MARFFKWYASKYRRWPYHIAFSTCAIKGSLADCLVQKNEVHASNKPLITPQQQHSRGISWKRNARFSLWSGTYTGCVQHFVYNIFYPRLFPGVGGITLAAKLAVDFGIHYPLIYLPSYYACKSLFGGNGLKRGLREYWDHKSSIVPACFAVWCPTMCVVLTFVPAPFRVGAIASVSFAWLLFLNFFSPMDDVKDTPLEKTLHTPPVLNVSAAESE